MSADRIYRAALDAESILAELERGRGTQWDPAVVDIVVHVLDGGSLLFLQPGPELHPILELH